MWHAKTTDEKHAEKRIRCYGQLAAVLLLLVAAAIPSPSWHGRSLAELALPIHRLIPRGVPSAVAAVLALAACYWLFRSPAIRHDTLICQKCNGVIVNDGRTQCHCGGALLDEEEMKWEGDGGNSDHPPAKRPPNRLRSSPP